MMFDVKRFLAETGAITTDSHIVYTGGDHGSAYVNLRVLKETVLQPKLAELSLYLLQCAITEAYLDTKMPLTVIGPETLGAIMAETAVSEYNSAHGTTFKFLKLRAQTHTDGSKTFYFETDAAPFIKGHQVIYFDDLMNAGTTLVRCRPLIEVYGSIDAVATIADRSGYTAEDLKVPIFISLVRFDLKRYTPDTCPLCQVKKPIVTNLGHGEAFEKANPFYLGGFTKL